MVQRPSSDAPELRFDVTCCRAGTDQERRASIRALVAILLEQPQRAVDAPGALATHRDLGVGPGAGPETKPEPLPYRQLSRLYSSSQGLVRREDLGGRRPDPGTARVVRRKKPTVSPTADACSPGMATRAKPKEGRRRPGTGGRKPREASGTATLATSLLQSALGEPTQVRLGTRGARCEIWERPDLHALVSSLAGRDPTFNSLTAEGSETEKKFRTRPRVALVNRLSSKEIQGGETIGGQILEGLRCAIHNDCEVVGVIASTNYRSELTLDEREDYNWVFEQVELGLLDGVIYREPDRVGRKQAVVHPFYEKCRKLGLRLYLARMDRAIDWDADDDHTLISVQNAFAEAEARRFARKSMEARRRRWVEEGRGWPGKIPFGFRRREDNFLEVDPEQWPFVEFIHGNYGRLAKDGKNGCRAVAEALEEQGCDLSPEKIRKILTDPIYVDGSFTVHCDGLLVACEPVPLERPIPRSTFQRNSEMLIAQKGAFTKTEPGTHLLNGLPVEHAACRDSIDPKTGCPPYLKVNAAKKGEPAYWHRGKTPKACHGYHVPQRALEAAVVQRLLELASDEELQAAWSAAALVDAGSDEADGDELDANLDLQRAELKQQIAAMEDEHGRQLDQIAELASRGTRITATHRAIAERIEETVAERKRRLEVLEANARRREAEMKQSSMRTKDELMSALRAILTEDIPADPNHKVRRQALVECCLSRVVIHDLIKQGDEDPIGYEIELFGPLVPERAVNSGKPLPVSPLDAGRHILEAELRDRDEPAGGAGVEGAVRKNSSPQVPTYKELFRITQERDSPQGRQALVEARSLTNRWPERFRGMGSCDRPAFRSPRLTVVGAAPAARAVPRPGRPLHLPDESECRQIVLAVNATLAPGEPLNGAAFLRWHHADPEHRIGLRRLRRATQAHGKSLRDLCRELVPDVHVSRPRPRFNPWTFERCESAIASAVAAHFAATGRPMRWSDYVAGCYGRRGLPTEFRVAQAAAGRGTSLGEMLRKANVAQGIEQTSKDAEAARLEDCRHALIEAATSLPDGRPPTIGEYDAWRSQEPSRRLSRHAISKVARAEGKTFAQFRNELFPDHPGIKPGPRPERRWTEARCLDAIRVAARELEAQGKSLTLSTYDELAYGRADLPSLITVRKRAKERHMDVAGLIALALKDTAIAQ